MSHPTITEAKVTQTTQIKKFQSNLKAVVPCLKAVLQRLPLYISKKEKKKRVAILSLFYLYPTIVINAEEKLNKCTA